PACIRRVTLATQRSSIDGAARAFAISNDKRLDAARVLPQKAAGMPPAAQDACCPLAVGARPDRHGTYDCSSITEIKAAALATTAVETWLSACWLCTAFCRANPAEWLAT